MSEWTEVEVRMAIDRVSEKATVDKDFRALVLSDPAEAVKQITGKDVPEGYIVRVIENDPGIDQTFVLPDFVGDELSDTDLEQAAGGKGCANACEGQCGSQCGDQKYG